MAHLAERAGSTLRWLAVAPAAVLFVLATGRQPTLPCALATAFFGAVLLILARRDLETRLIPNRIVYPSFILAVALSPLCPGHGPIGALAGALAVAAPAVGLHLLTGGGMGAGDVKMAAVVGAVASYPAALIALAIASLSGGVVALGLLALGGSRRTTMPYAPFLSIGAAAALGLR
ncbi:MAG: A24 family peptidase [Dehalococcoidia bacterium]